MIPFHLPHLDNIAFKFFRVHVEQIQSSFAQHVSYNTCSLLVGLLLDTLFSTQNHFNIVVVWNLHNDKGII